MPVSGFRFSSIGSGSKGNGTIISNGDIHILLDCGFSVREVETRLARLSLVPRQLAAILVTHEHSDHINGVGPLARKYNLPVYLTTGTWKANRIGELPDMRIIKTSGQFHIGDIGIDPVNVPHDANEPVQFVFHAQGYSLGVLTDIGSITDRVLQHYQPCDALVLETNHCIDMLNAGPYPRSLKQRVASHLGHLSNDQSAEFLCALGRPLKHLVLAHLSEQNNSRQKVRQALKGQWEIAENIHFACQQSGFGWLDI